MVDVRNLAWRRAASGNLGQRYARIDQEHDLSNLCLTCHVNDCEEMVEWRGKTGLRGDKFRPREQVGIYRQIAGWGNQRQGV